MLFLDHPEPVTFGDEVIAMWHWNGMGPWGWIVIVAFWTAVIALVAWAVRSGATTGRPDQVLGVLDERFARGETDQQEYEERRRTLQDNR